ncbi:MAG: class I SAM-dependent methyltransferase [Nitrospirota bacterium]|nr:class I SAM-dependent methyltransferase [Nitrospirota bacterium]
MTRRTYLPLHCLTLLLIWLTACDRIAYRQMNDPERDAWQQPKAVIQALRITSGAHIADLGAGGGYFTFRLAEAVGPDGKVYAVDMDEASLRFIEKEAAQRGGMPRHVELILATPTDPRLPLHSIDLLFTCDTYHHLPNRVAYLTSLTQYLQPNGHIAIIDFKEGGWLPSFLGHATPKDTVRQEMEAAGYRLVNDFDFLSKQHFQVFSPNTRE